MYTKKIQDYATTRLLVLSSILFCLAGCQEELSEPDTVALPNGESGMLSLSQLTEQDLQLVTFAQSLAKSLEDVAIRRYVKEQSLLNIDGENDMLYELIKSEQVGDRSFSSHLVAHLPEQNIPANARQNADAFFNKHFEAMPLLSLGVAVHLEKWDAEKYVPLVAVELSDHSEEAPYVRAYDSEGELHLLTLEEAPDVPTVVVRMNERIESLGHRVGKLMYKTSDFVPQTKEFHRALRKFDNYVLSRIDYGSVTNSARAQICLPDADPNECQNPFPPDDDDDPPSCDNRNCKSGDDKIYSLKFNTTTSFKELERWTERYIELYVLVFAKGIPLNPKKVTFGDRNGNLHYNHLQDCPFIGSCDAEVYVANKSLEFQWDEGDQGQYIGFRWMEADEGTTRSYSYSYKPCDTCGSFSTSFSRSDEDDEIGDKLVEYGSSLGTPQYLNRMHFTLTR